MQLRWRQIFKPWYINLLTLSFLASNFNIYLINTLSFSRTSIVFTIWFNENINQEFQRVFLILLRDLIRLREQTFLWEINNKRQIGKENQMYDYCYCHLLGIIFPVRWVTTHYFLVQLHFRLLQLPHIVISFIITRIINFFKQINTANTTSKENAFNVSGMSSDCW